MVDMEAPVEEIQLTASVVPTEDSAPEARAVQIRFDLVQRNPGRGIYRQFAICDDECLHILEQVGRQKRRYRVNLAFLDAEPQKQFIIARLWIYLATAALCVTLVLTLLSPTTVGSELPIPLAPTAIVAGAFSIVFLLAFIYKSRLRLCYRTRHGELELAELLWGRPSRRRYHDFVARLSGAIRDAQRGYTGSLANALAEELREHRRLQEIGVISSAAYEAAKQRILSSHGQTEQRSRASPG